MSFEVKPYTDIENQDYPQVLEWMIEAKDLENVEEKDGRIVFFISNCKFKKLVIKNTEKIQFTDISISFNSCYIESIEVEEIATKNISIDFGSSILSGQIKSPNIKSVGFSNCIIRDSFFLMDIPNISITYSEENIFVRRWLQLISSLKTDYLSLLKCFQKFYIYRPQRVNFTTSEKGRAKRGFYFDDYSPTPDLKYCFTDAEKRNLYIILHFDFKDGKEFVNVNISDSYLRSLSFNNDCKGSVNVENTKIDSLFVHKVKVEGRATFFNVSPFTNNRKELKIELHQSSLAGFTFERVAFKSYELISFYRTKFEDAKFNTCDFPQKPTDFEKFTSLRNVHYPKQRAENYYKEGYEIFIQLKTLLEKSGNFHEAQKLNAVANEFLMKTNDISWWDKLILRINSYSNYHGLSIGRPFGCFLLFSVAFYLVYLYSLDRLLNQNEIDWSLFGYYFSFIDITHRTDFLVDKKDFNATMLIVDFLSKIVTGFFLYQFIAAFRKYGKK